MSRLKSGQIWHWLRWAAVAILVFWSLSPILWTVLTSLKWPELIFRDPPAIIFPLDFTGYRQALGESGIYPQLLNTVIVAMAATIVTLLCGALAGYALSRFEFPGRRPLMLGLLAARLLPPISAVVPLYLAASSLGLIDTRLVLVLIYSALNIPFAAWLSKTYIDSVPLDLDESARLDGCSTFETFWRITLPLITPGLVAIGVFVFILSWNEFMFAFMFTSVDARTMPVVLADARGGEQILWQSLTAQASILIMPAVVVGVFLQKYLVAGLTAGAVK